MMKIEATINRYDDKTQLETAIQVTVEFEYQPAEPQELNYPGCAEEIEILAVTVADGGSFEIDSVEEDMLEMQCLLEWRVSND